MKLSVISVTDADRARGELDRDTIMQAMRALHEEGALVLRGALPTDLVDALHAEFSARFGGLNLAEMEAIANRPPPNPIQQVGGGRFDVAMRMTGAYGKPALFANKLLLGVIGPLLGGHLMRLSSMTAVASFPGAAAQHVHRDHQHLFTEFANISPALPLFAVNVSIPLIDIDLATGPTAIWPGSHRRPGDEAPAQAMVSMPFQRGDMVLMDYRTLHGGLANNSGRVRPILYLVYSREWFFDDNNHRHRNPLDMPLADIQALPQDLHLLMMRAYQQALRGAQARLPVPA